MTEHYEIQRRREALNGQWVEMKENLDFPRDLHIIKSKVHVVKPPLRSASSDAKLVVTHSKRDRASAIREEGWSTPTFNEKLVQL